MKKNYKLFYLIILVSSIAVGTFTMINKTPIQAIDVKSGKSNITKSLTTSKVGRENKNIQTRGLAPVENEDGLKATPKVFILEKDDSFPDLDYNGTSKLLSDIVLPEGEWDAEYQYVTADGTPTKPSIEKIGFQMIYVKITTTEKKSSIIVPVPVTISYYSSTAILDHAGVHFNPNIDMIYSKIILYPNEIKGKTSSELKEVLLSNSKLKAWNLETGEPAKIDVLENTIDTESVGDFTVTYEVTVKIDGKEVKETYYKEVQVFGAAPNRPNMVLQGRPISLPNLFSRQSFIGTGLDFYLVDEQGNDLSEVDTSKIGFQWIYVKAVDAYYKEFSTILKVPVNIYNDAEITKVFNDQVIVQHSAGDLFLLPDETKGKTEKELTELLKSKEKLKAWKASDGEELAINLLGNNVNNQSVGEYNAQIEIIVGKEKELFTRKVIVFGATLKEPYYHTFKQSTSVKNVDHNLFFSKFQGTNSAESYKLKFEWVADKSGKPTVPENTLDTSVSGFRWGYIKISDDPYYGGNHSGVMAVPITIISDEDVEIIENKIGMKFEPKKIFLEKDFKELSGKEILSFLNKNTTIKTWDLLTGEEDSVKSEITSTSIVAGDTRNKEVEITLTQQNKKYIFKKTIQILPDIFFETEDENGWMPIPLSSSLGVLTNSLNDSKISFPNRGLPANVGVEVGFTIMDSESKGYVYRNELVSDIPGVNNKPLYGSTSSSWARNNGLGYVGTIDSNLKIKLFLRKGNKLKQLLYDEKNEILFTYDISLNRNLNFFVSLKMSNLSNEAKTFSMLESVDTDYYNDRVPVYSLANSSGFYMQPQDKKKFSIKLKDNKGNWLSDYRKYIAAGYSSSGVSSGYNYFGDDFNKNGSESKEHKPGEIILNGDDSSYQLGAPWKEIKPGEALKTGYEIFAGQELPYMKIKADPEVFDVYQDYKGEFNTKYTLSKIPTEDSTGIIYINYPNEKEIQVPFESNKDKEFKDDLTIPRDTLPKNLNDKSGTIKEYYTSITGLADLDDPTQGLPSEDYDVTIRVHNLGAEAIPQVIEKGTEFTKKPEDILRKKVILPDHTASYEYEGDKLDTSTEGLKFVYVRMIDKDETKQTALIKVPVVVVEGTVPTSGIIIGANSFKSQAEDFKDLSKEEINKLIIEKSNAIAFDVETGSIEDIDLTVDSTTLGANPAVGEYTASFKAVKEFQTITKDIDVKIQPAAQNVIVTFKDEAGVPIYESIVLKKEVGTKIDLTKEEIVQRALKKIKDKHYALVNPPKGETAILVEDEEKTVTYDFKGIVAIQSAPKFLNFGRKTLGTMFIKVDKAKYDSPLTIFDNRKNSTPWTLTATLQKTLTSQEDPSKDLPRALRYKLNEEETVILKKGIVQPITKKSGKYNISSEWDKNESGLLLEVPSGDVLQPGGYRATILWQIQATP